MNDIGHCTARYFAETAVRHFFGNMSQERYKTRCKIGQADIADSHQVFNTQLYQGLAIKPKIAVGYHENHGEAIGDIYK
jgi:hypothetical protein